MRIRYAPKWQGTEHALTFSATQPSPLPLASEPTLTVAIQNTTRSQSIGRWIVTIPILLIIVAIHPSLTYLTIIAITPSYIHLLQLIQLIVMNVMYVLHVQMNRSKLNVMDVVTVRVMTAQYSCEGMSECIDDAHARYNHYMQYMQYMQYMYYSTYIGHIWYNCPIAHNH